MLYIYLSQQNIATSIHLKIAVKSYFQCAAISIISKCYTSTIKYPNNKILFCIIFWWKMNHIDLDCIN